MCSTLFVQFFPATAPFMEDVNKRKRNFFLFLNLDMVLNRNSAPGEYVDIRKCSKVGITAMKIERKRNHFLSEVFVTAWSSDLKIP